MKAPTAKRPGEINVWQRRFWERAIRDDEDMERHVHYIHDNPVKHGLVLNPDDWPHSSWRRWKADDGKPIAPKN